VTVSIGFFGAAGTVTGSKYLVRSGDSSVLVDCGMFQGEKRLRELNWQPAPFRATEPSAALLTHAHVDHSGLLPRFVREGFRGPIYATPATGEMAGILLRDSARLQEEDAEYANRKGYSRHHPALPLYTEKDVERALGHFRQAQYRQELKVAPEITARFLNAGHILGSAFIELTCRAPHGGARIVFSGDLGRYGAPLHSDPDPLPECDVLVMESTYGDRDHRPIDQTIAEFRTIVGDAVARRGLILAPAFAIGRAQTLLYLLAVMFRRDELPKFPVYLDSPMALAANRIYLEHPELIDAEARRFLNDAPLSEDTETMHMVESVAESRALNDMRGPAMIIASSGMATGGRIVHHLKHHVWQPDVSVLITGFQAQGTPGRQLVDGADHLTLMGDRVPVRASVHTLNGFSAHAGQTDLVRWFAPLADDRPRLALTHGEQAAREALAAVIAAQYGIQAALPDYGARFDM